MKTMSTDYDLLVSINRILFEQGKVLLPAAGRRGRFSGLYDVYEWGLGEQIHESNDFGRHETSIAVGGLEGFFAELQRNQDCGAKTVITAGEAAERWDDIFVGAPAQLTAA